MLKRRIVPVLLISGDRLVKSREFSVFRDVGDPAKSAAVYDSQLADELVILDISRRGQRRGWRSRGDLLGAISSACFMPIAVGGGVTGLDDAAALILNGADKVVINTEVYRNPGLISVVSGRFGSQAVVVGIDVRRNRQLGKLELYSNCGTHLEEVSLPTHLENCEAAGAGEIFVQSIDRDGMMDGMDVDLLREVSSLTSLPIIGCGGAGTYEHLREAFLAADVSAIACGSLFNFTDSNPMRAKAFLTNYGLPFKVV